MNLLEHQNRYTDQADAVADIRIRGCWVEIDINAIRHNYRQLRRNLPQHVKIYGCLKRNAIGCGAGVVAAALAQESIDGFAVASIADAIAIRQRGVSSPILLYPGPGLEDARLIEANSLTISVSSIEELMQWRRVLTTTRLFMKLDLGFFRAGTTPAQLPELLRIAAEYPDVQVEGLYAHMSELPGSQNDKAEAQLARMHDTLRTIETSGHRPALVMMSSTEGVLEHPDMDFDAVDPGALLLGISEISEPARPIALRPALKAIATRLVSVKRVDASLGPVPDGPGFRSGMILGVMAMGWGDGLPRYLPNGMVGLVRGRRASLIGPSHLEHVRIDLTDIPEARFGDEVVLLGRQGEAMITRDEVAARWGTDIIGLYAGLRDHVPKLYV
ncbi:alanine racemase [Neorhizobium sp. JUb45]|uniref:alanine racemase n=1 Tax=Neorhizobium sp. JUb45 TaxID=2485113 RepID=UPI0010474490|nr:alanine racemase [Neorhizobium sp. JUb45]TCQ98018.1 alanine racemase [Neorhizobium sp. JUb45]